MMFLTKAEVAELTGCRTLKAQMEWLNRNQVKHYPKQKGVSVPRAIVDARLKAKLPLDDLKPSISDIKSGKAGAMFASNEGGIYLLRQGDEVVYVGRTKNIFKRIADHHRDKEFDRVQFLKMKPEKQSIYEMELIKELRPKYNVDGIEKLPQSEFEISTGAGS